MTLSVPENMGGQTAVWRIREKHTSEASLTPTKEVEEGQAGRNVNEDTWRCEFGCVRDGNVDKDGQ